MLMSVEENQKEPVIQITKIEIQFLVYHHHLTLEMRRQYNLSE